MEWFVIQLNKTGQYYTGIDQGLTHDKDEAANFTTYDVTSREFHAEIIALTNVHGSCRMIASDC